MARDSITRPGRCTAAGSRIMVFRCWCPICPATLSSIAEMADWTAALLSATGATKAHLIGHSMGSLIALETAARHPDKVSALSLIGTAASMTVGPDLLKAAEANDYAAIDMVSIWGLGFN